MSRGLRAIVVGTVLSISFPAVGQVSGTLSGQATPSQDVEEIVEETEREAEQPLSLIDRPIYRNLQDWKKELNDKYGINWAVEDTFIYQATTTGDPNDAMVNTLGLFATWKIFRSHDGKDFGGFGFQVENRGNPSDDEFTDVAANLGTLWSPNDSTSGDYTKINQVWWGQRIMGSRIGYMIGKIDPGSHLNGNRFAGSGNTQFFGQPYATNPARSFPDNGLGFHLRFEPDDLWYGHLTMSDGSAVSTESPFANLNGHWFNAGEFGIKPKLEGYGQGIYRVMLYYREADAGNETGWSISADQNLSDRLGVFLRYGGNDEGLNAIHHLLAGGVSFLQPFDRPSDQAGVGVSWTHPADSDFRDEYATEAYYRLQVTEGFELSGSVQLIFEPSANEDRDTVAVFGLRARLLY